MADITDDQKEFTVGLEGEGETPAAHIRVRDDALLAEIKALRSAIELIGERLATVEGM